MALKSPFMRNLPRNLFKPKITATGRLHKKARIVAEPEIKDLAKTLGASETEASIAVLKESMNGVVLAVTASFNRAIAELGVVLMIGGNIAGFTSVLTTTIALETSKGEIALAIALAIILLLIVFVLTLAVNLFQRRITYVFHD